MTSYSIEIAEGLTAFCNTHAVDGRVSWHDPTARGFATVNCYLVQTDDEATLIDTGLRAHSLAVSRQLRAALRPGQRLTLVALRQGEFDSVGNLLNLVDEFDVRAVYGQFDDALKWADFVPELTEITGRAPRIDAAESKVLPRAGELTAGTRENRTLEFFRPVLRLLSTHWIYDGTSRTLFTSDAFGYNVQAAESGPWELRASNDETTVETVRNHLRSTRFWWLVGSDVREIRADLANTFSRLDVENIAPAFGSLILGREAVQRHVELLDEAISDLGLDAEQLQLSGALRA